MSTETIVKRTITGLFATYFSPKGTVLTARQGETIDVTQEEAERLDGCGTVAEVDLVGLSDREAQARLDQYRAERGDADAVAAVARAVASTDPTASASIPQPSVSPPGGGAAPVGTAVVEDDPSDTPVAPAGDGTGGIVRTDAPDIESSEVSAIAAWIAEEKPNATDTVALAEGDPAKAAKLLEAEQSVTGGDPRKTVEAPLQAIIDAGEPA